MLRRATAFGLVFAYLLLISSGCMSVRAAGSRRSHGAGGGIAVAVFANDGTRRAHHPGPAGVLGELQRDEGRSWVDVFRSLDATWTVAGLPPGRYRVRFPARLDDAGNVVRLDAEPIALDVREGRITDVQAVLQHVPTALVVAGVATAVVAAVLISKYLADHDLPQPPLPPPDVAEAIFYVTLDVASQGGWRDAGDSVPPLVTSHFPAEGAVVAARRPRVIFAMSEPLRPTRLEASGVTVLGERSGLAAGIASIDSKHWWVVWEPATDLAAGDTFHVTLAADSIEDLAGNELRAPLTFTFRTAR
jgi:Bacterial Ig-like domain